MAFTKSHLVLILALALCFFVEFSSSFAMSKSLADWYLQLTKPPLNPPSWLFGPVWTLLYMLMAISLWWIWKTPFKGSKKNAYFAFFSQLFFNWIWSFLFFGMRNPLLALIDIIALVICVIWMIVSFYKINRAAALLQLPYLLWTLFATYLNSAIWILNRP